MDDVTHTYCHPPAALGALPIRIVAKVALYTSLIAGIVLLLLVLLPLPQDFFGPVQVFHEDRISAQQLFPALMIIGVCLLSIVGLTTWMVVFYSSFKVAGPLYRFTRDLEVMSGLPEFRGIRSEDCLQDVSGQFRISIETLRSHYHGMHELLGQLHENLDSLEQREELEQAIGRVQEYAARVRVG